VILNEIISLKGEKDMPMFVMLIKLSPELAGDFKSMEEIGNKVGTR